MLRNLLVLTALSLSSCARVETDMPGVVDFYLEGETTRSFLYTKILPDKDRENGRITYRVTGAFGDAGHGESYRLTGTVDMFVAYDYRHSTNIANLPVDILRSTYSQQEIETVRTERAPTATERKRFPVTGDYTVVEWDRTKIPSVLTKPVSTRHEKCSGMPVESHLFGNAHLHIDEAGLVWLKPIMSLVDLPLIGTFKATKITAAGGDERRVEMTCPDGRLEYTLKKGAGLVYFEHLARNGTRTVLKEAHGTCDARSTGMAAGRRLAAARSPELAPGSGCTVQAEMTRRPQSVRCLARPE